MEIEIKLKKFLRKPAVTNPIIETTIDDSRVRGTHLPSARASRDASHGDESSIIENQWQEASVVPRRSPRLSPGSEGSDPANNES